MHIVVPCVLFALLVGVALLFRWLASGGEMLEAEQLARERRAVAADATVLAIEQSSAQRHRGSVLMTIRLRLDGANGREVRGFWEVEQAHIPDVQPGKQMKVRVDADDPRVCFPTLRGAAHSALIERTASLDPPDVAP